MENSVEMHKCLWKCISNTQNYMQTTQSILKNILKHTLYVKTVLKSCNIGVKYIKVCELAYKIHKIT